MNLHTLLAHRPSARQAFGTLLAIAGAVKLLLAFLWHDPSLAVLGVGLWLWIAIGLIIGNRKRIQFVAETCSAARLSSAHQARQYATLQKQLDRLVRRESEISRRISRESDRLLQGIQQLMEAKEQHSRFLHGQQQLALDGHSLVVRAFEDSHADLQDVRALVEEEVRLAGERAESLAPSLAALERALVSGSAEQDRVYQSIDQSVSALARDLAAQDENLRDRILRPVQDETQRLKAEFSETSAQQLRRLGQIELGVETTRERVENLMSEAERVRADVAKTIASEAALADIARRGLEWLKYETVQEVEALLQLRAYLDVSLPMPLLGGWAMDPAAILALIRYISEHRPSQVVECGSGSSTIWLAYALKRLGTGRLVSLDHAEKFAAATRMALHDHGLSDIADVRTAPLESVKMDGKTYTWYSMRALRDVRPIDLLIIDGPPGTSGASARYPALPLLADRLSDGALVVVDDATRKDEKKATSQWRNDFTELGDSSPIGRKAIAFRWRRLQTLGAEVDDASTIQAGAGQ
jgi:predicted O-methyltransferase YrrM